MYTKLATTLLATFAVASCSDLLAPSAPTSGEISAMLAGSRYGDGGYVHGNFIAHVAVGECAAGEIQSREVQACDVCVTMVEFANASEMTLDVRHLAAARYQGSASFARAVSAGQPDVSPAAGQEGVWVVYPGSFRISRISKVTFPSELQTRAGFEGAVGTYVSSIPSSGAARFRDNADLETGASALAGCATE